MYWLHRFSHWRSRWNPLWRIHLAHHQNDYLRRLPTPGWPDRGQFVFWLGDWRSSLDVVLVMTLPLLLLCVLFPAHALPLLILHYLYEVFLSEELLDHNPRVQGRWTRWFAWGDFHLHHHVDPRLNHGLIVTWWDRLFRTAYHPAANEILHRVRAGAARQQARSPGSSENNLRVTAGSSNARAKAA